MATNKSDMEKRKKTRAIDIGNASDATNKDESFEEFAKFAIEKVVSAARMPPRSIL